MLNSKEYIGCDGGVVDFDGWKLGAENKESGERE